MTDAPQSPPPEPAPQRIFLVVVDETPECSVALHYACLRARKARGRLALLRVLEPAVSAADGVPWMGVEDLSREEQRAEAEETLRTLAGEVHERTGAMPILHVREGTPAEELLALLDEEPSISILVLAAGTGPEGPGPLVSHFATGRGLGRLRIPFTVVPGTLSDEQLEAVTW